MLALKRVSSQTRSMRLTTAGDDADSASFDFTATAPGDWTHLAAAWDAASETLRVYENGELVGEREHDGSQLANPGTSLTIANVNASDSRYFAGSIDEVRASLSVRSADWIRATFRTASGRDMRYGDAEALP